MCVCPLTLVVTQMVMRSFQVILKWFFNVSEGHRSFKIGFSRVSFNPLEWKKKWDKALKWTSSQLSPGAKRSSANLKNCVWQLYQNCTPLGKKKNFTALAQPDFAILSNVKHLLQWCKDGKACLWGNSRRCERIANESRAKKVSW